MAIRPTPMNDNTGIVPPWLTSPKWAHQIVASYQTNRRHDIYETTLYDGYEPVIPDDMVRIMAHRETIRAAHHYHQAKQELQG